MSHEQEAGYQTTYKGINIYYTPIIGEYIVEGEKSAGLTTLRAARQYIDKHGKKIREKWAREGRPKSEKELLKELSDITSPSRWEEALGKEKRDNGITIYEISYPPGIEGEISRITDKKGKL